MDKIESMLIPCSVRHKGIQKSIKLERLWIPLGYVKVNNCHAVGEGFEPPRSS